MPAKSWLKKLNSTPDVSITPLHIQDVINVLIGDIEVNLTMKTEEFGYTIDS